MKPPDWASRLSRTLLSVQDPAVRVSLVRDTLRSTSASELVEMLIGLLDDPSPQARALLLSVSLALEGPELETLRDGARGHAAKLGYVAIVGWMRPRDTRSSAPPPRPPKADARPLTLGERKSLARRRDRNLLARALADPHRDVVRIVLGNPSLTEDDVVRLCANRGASGDALRQVFADPRWVVRYRVKRTLVLNPSTPLDVSLKLAPHLLAADRKEVATSGELPETLRSACAEGDPKTLH